MDQSIQIPFRGDHCFSYLWGGWGEIGINCFVMITGYFMCKSKITVRKFAKLLFEIMFYRIVINFAFWILGYAPFTISSFLKTLIPIKEISTGFTSAFIMFYLLIPFLNILIQHMNEKQHVYLLLWCGFTYVFLGTIPGFSVTMNYVSWFSVLFAIASYIRLYPKKIYSKLHVWVWLTLCFVTIDIMSVIGCTWLGTRIGRNVSYVFVFDSNTFLAVATGVCAFMLFKNIKIGYSKVINTLAASTFGVLLIHANSGTMRQWLWKDTLDVVGHYYSALMPCYAIGAVFIVYIVCAGIDYLRIVFIERPFFSLWDRYQNGIIEKYKKIESKIFSRIRIQE